MLRTALATIIGATIALGALVGCDSATGETTVEAPSASAPSTFETPNIAPAELPNLRDRIPHTKDGYLSEVRTVPGANRYSDDQLLAMGGIGCSLNDNGSPQSTPLDAVAIKYCDVLDWTPIYNPYNDPAANPNGLKECTGYGCSDAQDAELNAGEAAANAGESTTSGETQYEYGCAQGYITEGC